MSILETTAELSPAKKAWVTRRKLAEERTRAEALRAAPAPVIISSTEVKASGLVGPIVNYRCGDNDPCGCGWRLFVVIAADQKTVRLFSPSLLETITVARLDFDRVATPVRNAKPSRLAIIIRRNIATADRINDRMTSKVMSDGGADAQAALKILGA